MKKIVKIFLLLFIVLVITSCSNNRKDSTPTLDDSSSKIVGKYYTNIDCVFLPSWSEDSVEYETEAHKNRFIIKFSENCDYVSQPIKYKLDATTFSFTFNCKIRESDLIKRYDVYEDGVYLNYSCFIDKYDNVYIAEISIDKEKVYNMIIYLADNTILKTKLLKEMFYADFLFYKENCKSITGLEYCKLPFGPVPDRFETILSKGYQEDIIDYKPVITPSKEYYEITSKKKFNKDLFTKEELEVLDKIKKYFKNYNAKEIVDYSHKEKAFIDTNKCEKISYDYSFDIDLK